MLSGPLLVTDRLILRPPAAQDFDDFAAMCAEEDTMYFLGGPCERPVAWRSFTTIVGAWQIQGYSMFSVIERGSGAWVGRVGPWCPDGWPAPEIGYGLRREFSGRGYAYEAAVAACNFAVEFLGWDRLTHTIDPENTASIALARKLGAHNSGRTSLPAPLQQVRVDLWTQSAADWRQRRSV